jgi:GTP-binding protein LepA
VTYPTERIRNFCIVAHVDHGKSTLADRMLQLTELVDPARCASSTSTRWTSSASAGSPSRPRPPACPTSRSGTRRRVPAQPHRHAGHVDFSYEVSRALNACEGAVLLVDAAQGMEAQTIANLYLALEADLEIIPVLNKIDLPAARPDEIAREIAAIIGGEPDDVLRISAKTGEGVAAVLDAIVDRVPPRRATRTGRPGR